MKYLKPVIATSIFILLGNGATASHIRAGEVIARRVDNVSLTYQFTFFGYRDQEGVLFGQGRFDFGDGEIYGDDPGEEILWGNITDLGNGVERWEFTLSHTYQAANNYLVSYTEDFRNANIQNIAGSDNTSFFVETLIVIDALIGENNTPVFTVPPIDQGVVGFRFEHQALAFDPDGDSLAYVFTTPSNDNGTFINSYRVLNDPSFYESFSTGNQAGDGEPTLTLDPIDGTLVWDAPGGIGIPPLENREYNVAFRVEEYRKINETWLPLGYVTREMQIIIWNFKNNPPELEIPEDTCVVAGDIIRATVTGTDPDGNPVRLEAFGGPFEVNAPIATVSPDPPPFQALPAMLSFEWRTVCGHIRERPYEVAFKATDDPSITIDIMGQKLEPPGTVNFETWGITVVGPQPTGLVTDTQTERNIQLNWNPYSCPNADSMQVWRRVDEFEIEPECEPGIPENSVYELIKTLSISQTGLLDTNNGLGLSPGSNYCYRLVATFPGPTGGLSIASEEACDNLSIDVPVITNVDTKSTSKANGQLLIRWAPPYEIGGPLPLTAYTYSVLRTEGLGFGGTFTEISTIQSDTFLIDTGLNTDDLFYAYRIVLHDDTGLALDTSTVASSVRLDPTSQVGTIQLEWGGNTPWSLSVQEFPTHCIFRDHVLDDFPDSLVLIDMVDVTVEGLSYLDDGSFNGVDLDEEIEYCYFVATQGSYGNDLIPEPLVNSTQIVCVQPNDSVPPCTPISIGFDLSAPFSCEINSINQGCDFRDYQNRLIWEEDGGFTCDNDIRLYRIYFSETGNDGSFVLLEETSATSFTHSGLSSYAGCYQVASVDRSGNESERSEVFCNDNCPRFLLPNVFTPNGDGINDLFRPFYSGSLLGRDIESFSNSQCPRFVRSIVFKVFNRSGTSIFEFSSSESEGDFLINWDGSTSNGQELPSGVYYYSAEVTFVRLNPEDEKEVYNGWIQLLK